jgi:hypothetical protein
MQITVPAPTDDEIWNWRANIGKGIQIFNQKVQASRNYANRVSRTAGFRNLVQRFNQRRRELSLPELLVTLPQFTSGNFDNDLRQLELDAIRGFNGWGGRDQFGLELHEFRVAVDAQGLLRVADIDPQTRTGNAVWERVPVGSRPQRFGDPNYVNRVLRQKPSCTA